VWECPNFFRLGRKWVLIVSPAGLGRSIYFTGPFRGGKFTPELRGEMDLGGSLYAPQTFEDASGRRILFGWLRERRSRRAGGVGSQPLSEAARPPPQKRRPVFQRGAFGRRVASDTVEGPAA